MFVVDCLLGLEKAQKKKTWTTYFVYVLRGIGKHLMHLYE